jgi:hypothetical protein
MLLSICFLVVGLFAHSDNQLRCFKETSLNANSFKLNSELYLKSDYVFMGHIQIMEPLSDGSKNIYVKVTAVIDKIYKNKNNKFKVGQKVEFNEPKSMYEHPFDILKQRDLMLVERDGALHSLAFHSKYTPEQIIKLLDSSSKASQ